MIARDDISGLILAGGQGRRLQQADASPIDKGLVCLQGEPLVARMQRFMAPQVSEVWISANQHLSIYSQYGSVVADDPSIGLFQGPLAGIASVLSHVNTPWLFVMPVDMPHPASGLLAALAHAAHSRSAKICYIKAGHQRHPLCMLLHTSTGASLRKFLGAGQRRVQDWQHSNEAAAVAYAQQPHAFLNINTIDDLCVARQFPPVPLP